MPVQNDSPSPEDYARIIGETLAAYHSGKLSYGEVFDITSNVWRTVLARGLMEPVSAALSQMRRSGALSKQG